jgi:hypothetical protein
MSRSRGRSLENGVMGQFAIGWRRHDLRGFALLAPIRGVETIVVDRSKGCAQTTAKLTHCPKTAIKTAKCP